MLLSNEGYAETRQNRIVLRDVEPEAFRHLIHFVHTQAVDVNTIQYPTCGYLLELAERFDMKSLRENVYEIAFMNLTVDTAVSAALMCNQDPSSEGERSRKKIMDFVVGHMDELDSLDALEPLFEGAWTRRYLMNHILEQPSRTESQPAGQQQA